MERGDGGWCEASCDRLRQLWFTDLTTRAIATLMGRTKNMIVGKARRLGLPGRPNPIVRNGERRPPRPARAPKLTLVKPVPVPPIVLPRISECCFPLNDRRPWRLCCEPASPDRPYCARHCAVAYTSWRARTAA